MENEAAQLRRKLSSVREENSSLVMENRQLISDLEAAQIEIASSKSKVPHISWSDPPTLTLPHAGTVKPSRKDSGGVIWFRTLTYFLLKQEVKCLTVVK